MAGPQVEAAEEPQKAKDHEEQVGATFNLVGHGEVFKLTEVNERLAFFISGWSSHDGR